MLFSSIEANPVRSFYNERCVLYSSIVNKPPPFPPERMVGAGSHLQDHARCRAEHVCVARVEETTRQPKQGVRYSTACSVMNSGESAGLQDRLR